MGLPMWTVPSQTEANKPDAATASARSPIRRRRSPDPRRNHNHNHNHHSQSRSQSQLRREAIPISLLREAAEQARHSFVPPAPSLPNPIYRSLSPPPEGADADAANDSDYGRSARRPFWAHLDSAAARLRVDAFTDPARPSVRRNGLQQPQQPQHPQHPRYYRSSSSDVRDGAVSELPPLRRMAGGRYVVDQPLRTLPPPEIIIRRRAEEGATSENESGMERPTHDDWANMSFGILPDTLQPSADSSFTSAAASASFSAAPRSNGSSTASDSRSQSANSSSTSLTTLSADVEMGAETLFRTMQEALDRVCEDSNDTEADDDDEPSEETPRRPHRRYRAFPFGQSYYVEPLALYRNSRGMRHRSREASRFVRHYQGYVGSRTASPPLARENASRSTSNSPVADDETARSSSGPIIDGPIDSLTLPPLADTTTSVTPTADSSFEGGTSLEHMRRILSRMARDVEIPDEWWISAGLTPTLVSGRYSPVEPPSRNSRSADLNRLSLPRLQGDDAREAGSP